MRLRLAAFFLIAGVLAPASSHAQSITAADAAAIRAVVDRQTDAWNHHDIDAFVADTTPDVDWINIVGMHWEGRDTVRRAHTVLHKGLFAHSSRHTDALDLRQIAPNVVVAVLQDHIEGAGLTTAGAPYPIGGNILTLVFVKTDAGWRIAHAHNTTIDRQAAQHDPARAP
jgi:uncharacterized protein (TIGR02246 family)